MTRRNKLVALTTALAIVGAGWAWTGAAAEGGRGPSQPIGEGTITYQRSEMVRPTPSEGLPTEALNGLFWVSQSDLTFHPLVPCRIVDTRELFSHGRLPNDTVDSFNVVATDYSSQGGFAGDCGVPNRALAVEVNVVAANPSGQGYLKLYPAGATQPNASILNYSAGQTIANSATVGRCTMPDGGLCGNDLSIYAHTATDILVDVLGYYEGPLSVQVDSNGLVFGASLGLFSVTKNDAPAGSYDIRFYRDVSTCVFSASIGWGDALYAGPGEIDVEDLATFADGAHVTTYNVDGTPTNFAFQLVADC